MAQGEEQGIIRRERTNANLVALVPFLYTKGLSTRQVARVLIGVRISHVAVWNWITNTAGGWTQKPFGSSGSLRP